MLNVNDIWVKLGKKNILKGISFQVNSSSLCAMLGPIGSGKTTTIRTILRLIKPYKGTISLDGKAFYIPQTTLIYPSITGHNICYIAGCQEDTFNKLCNIWEIPCSIPIHNISEGQRRLIFWAAALSSDADIILADEPWQGIDLPRIKALREHMIQWVSDGKSILMASHQIYEVEKIADTVIFINDGEIVLQGNMEDLKEHRSQTLEQIYMDLFGGEYGETV